MRIFFKRTNRSGKKDTSVGSGSIQEKAVYVSPWFVLLISLGLPLVSFLLQGDIGLPNPDEGYLWYGALRTLLGEMPIRDFQSYDPGRYYWSAFFLWINPGILSFRFSLILFQVFTLFFGLWFLRKAALRPVELFVMAIVLTLWLTQRHRVFEYGFSMISLCVLFWTAEKPSIHRWLTAGCFVGFSAFFGRNMCLYHLMAFQLYFLWLAWKGKNQGTFKKFSAFAIGILIGFIPLIAMAFFSPEFGENYWEEINKYIFLKTTNISWPAPWIWNWHWITGHGAASMMSLAESIFFIAPLLFYLSVFIYLVISPKITGLKILPMTTACIGICYAHYGISRPDMEHVAASIIPFLIGIPTIFQASKSRILAISLLFVLSLGYAGEQSYLFRNFLLPRFLRTNFQVGDDTLRVRADSATSMESLRVFVAENVKPEESIWAVPDYPQFYPLTGRKSPVWETYYTHQYPIEMQKRTIKMLESNRVNWLLLRNSKLGGPQGRTFQETSTPLLWDYLATHYHQVTGGDVNSRFQIFHKMDTPEAHLKNHMKRDGTNSRPEKIKN
jgi:hypothetical protein